MKEVAAEIGRTIHSGAPKLRRVTKYGAPMYRGLGDVCTIGTWKDFVAVGFWNGSKLASQRALLEGSGAGNRVAKLRAPTEARSLAFKGLVRDAARLDSADPVRPI